MTIVSVDEIKNEKFRLVAGTMPRALIRTVTLTTRSFTKTLTQFVSSLVPIFNIKPVNCAVEYSCYLTNPDYVVTSLKFRYCSCIYVYYTVTTLQDLRY